MSRTLLSAPLAALDTAGTPSRRGLFKVAGAAAVAAALPASALAQDPQSSVVAAPAADLILRRIPRTGELIPAVGLGTFATFDSVPGRPRGPLREVTRRFLAGGGRLIDTAPLYGMAEVNVGDFVGALDAGDRTFLATKIWATGDYLGDDSHAQRSLTRSLERLWRDQIDLLQVHSLVNASVMLQILRGWKRDGRIRHLGVTHHEASQFDALSEAVEHEDLDFVQLHYSIFERGAERRLLPVAADRGTAVLVNMPLEKARLHHLVEGRALPAFAREFGMQSWAEFFLKWVIAHPAVTVAIPGTTNPDHVLENIAAMRGPLPDPAMRARMVQFMEGIPGFRDLNRLGQRSWYPGKAYTGSVTEAQARLAAQAAVPR